MTSIPTHPTHDDILLTSGRAAVDLLQASEATPDASATSWRATLSGVADVQLTASDCEALAAGLGRAASGLRAVGRTTRPIVADAESCPAWCDRESQPHDDWARYADGTLRRAHVGTLGEVAGVTVYLEAWDVLTGREVVRTPPELCLACGGDVALTPDEAAELAAALEAGTAAAAVFESFGEPDPISVDAVRLALQAPHLSDDDFAARRDDIVARVLALMTPDA